MEKDIIAINRDTLKKLILDIYDYRDKLSKILEDAELVVESTKSFYQTADAEEFRKKFKQLSSNFPIFLENIKSYGEDLEKVLSIYKENDLKSVDIFDKMIYDDSVV